jgi:hypothetical protein
MWTGRRIPGTTLCDIHQAVSLRVSLAEVNLPTGYDSTSSWALELPLLSCIRVSGEACTAVAPPTFPSFPLLPGSSIFPHKWKMIQSKSQMYIYTFEILSCPSSANASSSCLQNEHIFWKIKFNHEPKFWYEEVLWLVFRDCVMHKFLGTIVNHAPLPSSSFLSCLASVAIEWGAKWPTLLLIIL